MTDEEIQRINQLARKARSEGLSDAESSEQHDLRQRYVAAVKRSLRGHLDQLRPPGEETQPRETGG